MTLRLLHLLTRCNIGGPARHVLAMARLLGADHEVHVAAGRAPSSEGELTDAHVPVVPVPLVRRIDPATDARALRACRQLLRKTRPEVLHTHMAKAGAIGRTAAAGTGIATVHTYHGHVLEGYFGRGARGAFLRTERFLARRTDRLVAVSAEIRDELLDLGVGRRDQYRVIAPGIDLTPFLAVAGRTGQLRSRLGVAAEDLLVVALGRLAPVKGYDLLVRAVADLPGVHLAILGDGEERAPLAALVQALGLGDRVHLPGWWSDVPAALADADVVALTSRHEGTPLALVEAAAAGKAIVATDVGGVRAVIDHPDMGAVVPRSQDTVAAALDRYLADEALRARTGAAARASVPGRFSDSVTAAALQALYEEALLDRSGR